jgi:hypothetical protein
MNPVINFGLMKPIYLKFLSKKKYMNKQTPKLKAEKKEYRPKPWLLKPTEEKKVQGYYYVKYKHKDQVRKEIDKLLNQYK